MLPVSVVHFFSSLSIFFHFPADGYLAYFLFFLIFNIMKSYREHSCTNCVCVCVCKHMSLFILSKHLSMKSLGPWLGICLVLKNCQTFFPKDCTILHACNHGDFQHFLQPFCLVFFILVFVVGVLFPVDTLTIATCA